MTRHRRPRLREQAICGPGNAGPGNAGPRSLGPVSTPIEVPIRDETIRLGQLLKLAGVVDDGAMAREVIERGVVAVNGEVDTRRGRQVRAGDVVTFEDEALHVIATP